MRPVDNDVTPDANPLAVALAGMPEVWKSLLIDHEPDRHNRCVACRTHNRPGVPWPCTLRVAAEDACDLARAREAAADGPATSGSAPEGVVASGGPLAAGPSLAVN